MIRAIAVDDEPKAIDVIRHHVSKIDHLDLVAQFHNAHAALEYLKDNPIELIFLDINMPQMSGMQMLDKLKFTPHIIFTTAYSSFALNSYDYEAVDYLLKPFEFDRFLIAVKKVEQRMSNLNSTHTFFFVKDGFKNVRLEFDRILFIKGSGNYLDITTVDKQITTRMTFQEIIEKLPMTSFIRVHQSYLVNISLIDKIENNHIHISSSNIPISSKYKSRLFDRLNLT